MFKFWRRKRDEQTPQEPAGADVAVNEEVAAKSSFFSVTKKNKIEPSVKSLPEVEAEVDKEATAEISLEVEDSYSEIEEGVPEPIQQTILTADVLEEVELPKRKISGVRGLFGKPIDLDELEDILLRADFGVETAEEISAELKELARKNGVASDAELRLLLKDLLSARLTRTDSALNLSDAKLPYVILVVGVNGAGKTTTIGKLAKWLSDGQWKVVLGGADTFRAAAVDQLATWAQRADVDLVRPEREGQDPASVAYQTVERALAESADIAIIDTAGRLQNKKDLMDELAKVRRAVEKQAQINEVLLVIDATTGQNGLNQAKAFLEVANVTGVVMTKLDGTAKGGILYSLQKELDIPIKLVGVGEGINDFAFFDPEEFARGLVAIAK